MTQEASHKIYSSTPNNPGNNPDGPILATLENILPTILRILRFLAPLLIRWLQQLITPPEKGDK